MRTWGRTTDVNGVKTWVKVETDDAGNNEWVLVTALCQTLLLNLNESPFYADWGIPAKPTVIQQVQPDYYVARTQAQYSAYFANLVVAKERSDPPTYNINVTTLQGTRASVTLEVPQ